MRSCMRENSGFSLLEVLIALLVLSVGLLGASSMQLSALNNNQGAYSRFQAVNIANDLSERMHANVAAVDSGLYAAIDFTDFDCGSKSYKGAEIDYCSDYQGTAAVECSTSQMAIFDAYEIFCDSDFLLLEREIKISCQDSDTDDSIVCSPSSIHTIQVAWAKGDWNQLSDNNCPVGKSCINLEVLP